MEAILGELATAESVLDHHKYRGYTTMRSSNEQKILLRLHTIQPQAKTQVHSVDLVNSQGAGIGIWSRPTAINDTSIERRTLDQA